MIPIQRVDLPADRLPGEAVLALYFSDQKPLAGPAALLDWRLDGQLTRMLLGKQVQGRAGEHVLLQSNGKLQAERVLFVGGGKWQGLCTETHGSLVAHMLGVAKQAGFRDVSLALLPHPEAGPEVIQQQIEQTLRRDGAGIESCRLSCETTITV